MHPASVISVALLVFVMGSVVHAETPGYSLTDVNATFASVDSEVLGIPAALSECVTLVPGADFISDQKHPAGPQAWAGISPSQAYWIDDVGGMDVLSHDEQSFVVRAQNGGVFGSLGRLRFDYADDFGDEVRIRGQLMSHLTRQFGIDAAATWYDASHNSDFDESFWTGDANLVYRLGDTRSMLLRFGVGTSYILRHDEADFGYNLTYGADVFIKRPWLLSGEMDWGAIGGDKLLHWRVTAGAVLGRLEIYAGYDKFDLHRFNYDGPIAGVGWIF